MIEPLPLSCRKCLQWDIIIMPIMLEVIWTIQVKFFFHQRTKHSTFLCPMFHASQQSLTELFVVWKEMWTLKTFMVLKLFSRKYHLILLELHSASVRALIWFNDWLVSCRTIHWILLLNADKIFLSWLLAILILYLSGSFKKSATAALLCLILPLMAHWEKPCFCSSTILPPF